MDELKQHSTPPEVDKCQLNFGNVRDIYRLKTISTVFGTNCVSFESGKNFRVITSSLQINKYS